MTCPTTCMAPLFISHIAAAARRGEKWTEKTEDGETEDRRQKTGRNGSTRRGSTRTEGGCWSSRHGDVGQVVTSTHCCMQTLHPDTNSQRTCDDKSTRLHLTVAPVLAPVLAAPAPVVAAPPIRSFVTVACTISLSPFRMLASGGGDAASCFCLSASAACFCLSASSPVAFVLRFSTTCTSPIKKSEAGRE